MSGENHNMEARFGPAGNAIAFSRQYKSSLDLSLIHISEPTRH